MECGQCGAQALDDQRFCGQCGAPLVLNCPNCAAENPPANKFCGTCGTALAASAPEADRQATERRVVSVMFVDIVGFTSFSEGRDPEDVRELITRYFDIARDIIERFGGTVDKFIGDAVMAWWGATTSQEDDAERAVRSSLEIVDAVATLGEEVGIPELRARAGVMTGEAAVGPGGNERGLLLGDMVNSASRLQSLAQPGTVYVGDVTKSLVETAIEVESAGTHAVKGKEETITAWQATRVLAERGGRGRADVLEPPFTGRTAELRLLKDALHATGREKRARLVSLIGQAGIGKSRLLWEFLKYIDGLVDDVYWHEGRSPSYGDGVALWALGEMIRGRAGIQETDPDDVTAARLAETVNTYVDAERADWVRDRLSAVLGLSGVGSNERSELYAAARAFFESIASRGTTVLVFEDLHWADPGLLEFIEELPDWSQNHPIMVVTLSRPDLLDRRPDWGSGRRGFTSVYLTPLTDEEMAQVISGTIVGLGDDAVGKIVEAAAGVPLFAVEMMRMLLGDGRVEVDEDGNAVSADVGTLDVPSSVQAIIAARIDRLPPDERDLARDASVLGFSFTLDGLAALREESVDKLERWLTDLIRHEILELIRDPRSPERGQYQWVQSVLREVAYGRISRTDKRDLHLKVARYFVALEDPELAPVAATHYLWASEQSEEGDAELEAEMGGALRVAVDRVRAVNAHEQVITLVDAALPVVSQEVAVELNEFGAVAGVRLNQPDVAVRYDRALQALANDDPTLRHRAMALHGFVGNETRRSSDVLDDLAAHYAAHPDLGDDPYLTSVAVHLSRAQLLGGDDDKAAAVSDVALGAAERLGLIDSVADALITRGTALSHARNNQAMALLRGALRLCREHDLTATMLRAMINIGYASVDPIETVEVSREAFEEAKRVGDRNHGSFVGANLASAYLYMLKLDLLDTLLDEPVMHDAHVVETITQERAALAALRGDVEAADRMLTDAEQTKTATDAQVLLGFDRERARIALLSGDYEHAFEVGRRHFTEMTFAPALSIALALAGASMAGNPEWLSEVEEMADTLPPGGFNDPIRHWAVAAAAAARGEQEKAIRMTDSITPQAEEHSAYSIVLHNLSVARLLAPDDEARQRFVDRARAIAEKANAGGLVTFVDTAAD